MSEPTPTAFGDSEKMAQGCAENGHGSEIKG
ncbi:MAG: Uncharacterised protein [Methanobacteriota archaeon]|nr:MAG: Uncharacterised protein [Euryarchaeota archaeon]